jgi:holo-[acyl-carrier protein] synthase
MILGIGTDIIEIDRIRKTFQRYGDRFLARIFTRSESDYCLTKADPAPNLAARFAAKEAVYKAVNGVIGLRGIPWRDIEVVRAPSGAPSVRLYGMDTNGLKIHLSMSHSRDYVSVVAILEQDMGAPG